MPPLEKLPPLRKLLLSVAALWLTSGLLLYFAPERGTFGDMFGAVNALFSGLAFATLIYTAWMQREELALQRQELELTRAELRGQKEELSHQNIIATQQRYESTFFELLRVHGQIVDSIDLVDPRSGIVTRSRDCFRAFFKRLSSAHAHSAIYSEGIDPTAVLNKIYMEFNEEHQEEVGHYFRHLYHIVKFVKFSPLEDKQTYVNFVRAQLSSYELLLLFYNCLSEQGNKSFKPLVEEYALLKNMPVRQLLMPDMHQKLYDNGAYVEKSAA